MKTIYTILILVAFSAVSSAQNDVALQSAFKSSYANETKSDFTAAIKDLKAVYSETSYEVNLRLGWLSYSAGLFTESMAYYKKAIDLMPASVEAKFGFVYPAAAVGNWDQVKTQYENILKIDAKNTQAHYRLGLIYYGREEFDKALQHFQVGFNLYPFDYDFNLMMAWTSLKMGKLREAKVLFNKVLLLSPDDESAKEGLGLIK
jgi:tetratricopeptide (TPR) repeat protein